MIKSAILRALALTCALAPLSGCGLIEREERYAACIRRPQNHIEVCSMAIEGGLTGHRLATAHYERAVGYIVASKTDTALTDLNKALKLDPDHVNALSVRGALLAVKNRGEEALIDLEKAAQLRPGDIDILSGRANAYRMVNRFDDALADIEAALDVAPDSAGPLTTRCHVKTEMGGDLASALDDCNAALHAYPDLPPALLARAMVHLKLGKNREAYADFDAAYHSRIRQTAGLFGRGLARQKLGETRAGKADMDAALTETPTVTLYFERAGLWP